jgi:adenine-specific DNA-methyltransferase
MLNLLLKYENPEKISKVSGIPNDWNRSLFNKEKKALQALTEPIENIKSKYIMVSFNSEGFISIDQMLNMLKQKGKVDVLETKYNAFRGSRNLNKRNIHTKEFLFLLEK